MENTTMPLPESVYHHTGLESSGGATRVARLLMEGLGEQGVESNLSFELGKGRTRQQSYLMISGVIFLRGLWPISIVPVIGPHCWRPFLAYGNV